MDRERVVLLELFERYERLSKRHDFENLNQHENVVVPFFSTSQQSDDVLSSLPRMDGKAFLKNRQDLQEKILKIFEKKLFLEQRFPVKVEWSKTLNKTAGVTLCKQKGSNREAKIQLASKVITSTDRLISTLAHEMCHAAAFMIDGTCKPPHGPCFYKWGRMFEQCFPGVKGKTTFLSYF